MAERPSETRPEAGLSKSLSGVSFGAQPAVQQRPPLLRSLRQPTCRSAVTHIHKLVSFAALTARTSPATASRILIAILNSKKGACFHALTGKTLRPLAGNDRERLRSAQVRGLPGGQRGIGHLCEQDLARRIARSGAQDRCEAAAVAGQCLPALCLRSLGRTLTTTRGYGRL